MATLYARLDGLIDGVIQVELTMVDVEFEGGLIPVNTIQKPRAGFTEGAGGVNISGNAAIPAGGLEFDFPSAAINHTEHSFEITIGSQSYVSNGMFMTAKASQSANANSECSFTWQGIAKPLV